VISDDLTIACGDGELRLLKVQRAGSKAMTADELLKGFAMPRGTRLT
jgi:methionyl-tRNA formyltransferase